MFGTIQLTTQAACTALEAKSCPQFNFFNGVECEWVGDQGQDSTSYSAVVSCGSGRTSVTTEDSNCLYMCPNSSQTKIKKETVRTWYSLSCTIPCPPAGGSGS